MEIENQTSATLENHFEEIWKSMKEIIQETRKELQNSINEAFKPIMEKLGDLKASNERALNIISELKNTMPDHEAINAAANGSQGNSGTHKVFDECFTRGTVNRNVLISGFNQNEDCLCVTTTQSQPMYDDSGGRIVYNSKNVSVSLAVEETKVSYDPNVTNNDCMIKAIEDAGFGADLISSRSDVTGKWLGSKQIRCYWATKSAGANDNKQSYDVKSSVELTSGSSENGKEVANSDDLENNPHYTSVNVGNLAPEVTLINSHNLFHALSATCRDDKILVANRGEIVVRMVRTAYEMGIPYVAVYLTMDKDALHVKVADESVCIGEAPSPILTSELRKAMGDTTVATAASIGYIGAGYYEMAGYCIKDGYGVMLIECIPGGTIFYSLYLVPHRHLFYEFKLITDTCCEKLGIKKLGEQVTTITMFDPQIKISILLLGLQFGGKGPPNFSVSGKQVFDITSFGSNFNILNLLIDVYGGVGFDENANIQVHTDYEIDIIRVCLNHRVVAYTEDAQGDELFPVYIFDNDASTMVLKEAAVFGLCLVEMGEMLSRVFLGDVAGIVIPMFVVGAIVAFFIMKQRFLSTNIEKVDSQPFTSFASHKVQELKSTQTSSTTNTKPFKTSTLLNLRPPPVDRHRSFDEDDASVKPIVTKEVNTTQINAISYSMADLQMATNNFSFGDFINEGSTGCIYQAQFDDGRVLAVKQIINTYVLPGHLSKDFMNMGFDISWLRHPKVTELMGYCSEHGQHLLVYEFRKNGSLHDFLHLLDEYSKPLTWNNDVKIVLRTACALEYLLPEACSPSIVHKNFKSANEQNTTWNEENAVTTTNEEAFSLHFIDCLDRQKVPKLKPKCRSRGSYSLEYSITLLSVTEPMEEKMEQALFSPPLSKQRVEFALQHIKESCAASLVDFGCGSGSLLDSLLACPTSLENIVGVDISQRSLARAAKLWKYNLDATLDDLEKPGVDDEPQPLKYEDAYQVPIGEDEDCDVYVIE